MISLDQIRPYLNILDEPNKPRNNHPLIAAVSEDSRAVQPGSLFVAIAGDSFDGHCFIPNAIDNGAVAVIGTTCIAQLAASGVKLPATLPYLQVSNSRAALAWCSAALYDFPSRAMAVIGITGTDGKTSTATILESILTTATVDISSALGKVGVITTVGARIQGQALETGLHVTTPNAPDVQRYLAKMRDASCEFAIVESTSHGLAQGRVAAVEFDVAAVTNITHEHLDYHGTWEAYAAAKATLFEALFETDTKPGVVRLAVLNADDRASHHVLTSAIREASGQSEREILITRYGIHDEDSALGCDVFATNITYRPDRTQFDIITADTRFPVMTPLIGDFNVYNILCATSIALGLGVSIDAIQMGVANLKGIVGRMERIDRGQPFLALVDFAHSPASLERALQTLRTIVSEGGRIIAVFGSAGLRDQGKRRLMGQTSGRFADFTVITAEDPRTEKLERINEEIEAGVRESAGDYTIVPDRTEAIQYAVNLAKPDDIVAAFGKGHERSMCFGTVEYPWHEQAVMADALERRMQREAK